MDENLLLTERQTGALLNISRTSIRRRMAEGKLRPVKVGKSLRFVAEDIHEFVRRLKVEQYPEEGK